jgi:hypothetical protein
VSLIIEDENRHHRSSRTLPQRSEPTSSSRRVEPAMPRLDDGGTEPARVVEVTDPLPETDQADPPESAPPPEGATDRRPKPPCGPCWSS